MTISDSTMKALKILGVVIAFAFQWASLHAGLDGMREDLGEIKTELREMREVVSLNRRDVAALNERTAAKR